MSDYEKLAESLRVCGSDGECSRCPQYDNPSFRCMDEIQIAAADAIEDLIVNLTASNEVLVKYGKQIPKWIPVTERMPQKDEDVLIFGKWAKNKAGFFTGQIAVGTIRELDEFCGFTVTHWMPLPPPPKGEQDG